MDTALTLLETLPADRHPAAVYLRRLGPGSQRTMREALDVIASVLTGGRADTTGTDWAAIRYQHAQGLRSVLVERGYAPATVNKYLAALRGVVREAFRLGLMPAEESTRVLMVDSVRGERLPAGRALGSGELSALFGACARDRSPSGRRDAAMLALLYGAGLRRSEIVGLALADFDPETGALAVRRAKFDKQRTVYATNGARDALAAWLTVRGDEPGPLFLPILKGGRIQSSGMTGQAVLNMLAKRAGEAEVSHFSPHDLRRTFVSDLLDRGADIVQVQRLAGHANVTTTARYDRRGEVEKRRAAEMLHVPYRAEG